MRTNIVLDDSLVKEAFLLSGVKTKKDLISLVLIDFFKGVKNEPMRCFSAMAINVMVPFREATTSLSMRLIDVIVKDASFARSSWDQFSSDLENARSLLSDRLPDKVLKLVDLNTLEISKDSFIEKDLAEYHSDMLYKVKLIDGSQGFIYVLFEHKSYYDRFVHLQLLEYMVKIWRLYIKQHKKQPDYLPIVIPLLVCHARKEWPEDTVRLASLLSGPVYDLTGYIPDFGFELYDLHRYLASALEEDELTWKQIKEIVEQAISKETGGYVMTLEEKVRNEGKQEGKLEGLKARKRIQKISFLLIRAFLSHLTIKNNLNTA